MLSPFPRSASRMYASWPVGWLQGVVGPLVAKLARRNAAELGIHKWQQLVERIPIAATPIAEQRRHIARREHWSLQSVGSGVPA